MTGQFSTQLPHPVHSSISMLRARFLSFTLKLPSSPEMPSTSERVSNSMLICRPTSTSFGAIIHMAQSLVGKVLSSWDIIPPMEPDFSTR